MTVDPETGIRYEYNFYAACEVCQAMGSTNADLPRPVRIDDTGHNYGEPALYVCRACDREDEILAQGGVF